MVSTANKGDYMGPIRRPHLRYVGRMTDDGVPTLDAVLMLLRTATDTGHRTGLDEVIAAFGFNRSELELELEAEGATGTA